MQWYQVWCLRFAGSAIVMNVVYNSSTTKVQEVLVVQNLRRAVRNRDRMRMGGTRDQKLLDFTILVLCREGMKMGGSSRN